MGILFKRMITFLLLLVIGYFFFRKLLKGGPVFFRKRPKGRKRGGEEVQKMEKDPVCGTYVPEKTSLKLKSEGEMYYFCSDKCRNEYIQLLKK